MLACRLLCPTSAMPGGVSVSPVSGIKQGDPLSLAIFVMACSVLVEVLQRISPLLNVLFHADDLLLYIPAPPSKACALLPQVFEKL